MTDPSSSPTFFDAAVSPPPQTSESLTVTPVNVDAEAIRMKAQEIKLSAAQLADLFGLQIVEPEPDQG